jgi:hypothetical protein
MASENISLKQVMDLLRNDNVDGWVLHPVPIEGVDDKEFAGVLRDARVHLWHTKWKDAREAARELSDVGGVKTVHVYRVKRSVYINSDWEEGKQVS